MIARCSFLMDIPFLTNCSARYSSSSGFGRPLAADSEVTRRIHDARAEMPLPDAVDDHPHGDRLFEDIVRQFQSSAALLEGRADRPSKAGSGNGAAPAGPGSADCREWPAANPPVSPRPSRRVGTDIWDPVSCAPRPRPPSPHSTALALRRPRGFPGPSPRNSSTPGLPPRPPAATIAAMSSASFNSRWKISVQKEFSSSGMFLSRSPQPGQKSSLVINSLGLLARFFFLVPSSALAAITWFSSFNLLVLQHHLHDVRLELVGQFLYFRVDVSTAPAAAPAASTAASRKAAATTAPASAATHGSRDGLFHHGLPGIFVVVLIGGLFHVLDPPHQQLVIQLPRFHYRLGLLLLPGHFIHALQVVGRLERQRFGQARTQIRLHLLQHLLLFVHLAPVTWCIDPK